LGCEDALGHLLNYIWPNIFEVSAHVINAVMEAIEGLMVALGPAKVCYIFTTHEYTFLIDYAILAGPYLIVLVWR
jgi:hypothetical protein